MRKKDENNVEKKRKKIKKEKKLKEKKVKIKLKNKKILIPLICGCFLLIVFIIVGFIYYNKQALKMIKKNYNQYVVTTKRTTLYNKNKKAIGTIEKNIDLILKKIDNPDIHNKYLAIENTPYYISYKNIKPSKEKEIKEDNSYYLPSNIHINTKKKVDLLKDNKTIITLNNGLDSDIVFMDAKNYYIDFQGMQLSLSKNKNIKESTTDKKIENAAEKISVIYYENISNECGDDNCLKPESVKIHIKKLQDEGYYFITKNDYISFIFGYRNLLDKAVFMTTSSENDFTKNIKDELGVEIGVITNEDQITMQTTNKVSTRDDSKEAVNRYQAKRYTLIDEYSSMAAGLDVIDNGRQNDPNMSVPVMNYHFFYDASKGEHCDETICMEVTDFREELQWLKDNEYKTLTIHEFADWMDGNIEIPNKSVLLTVDDGAMGTSTINGNILIPTLEEYQMHATLFLISGWWDKENYESPYLDVQSHTHGHHEEASCADGRGNFVCASYEEDKEDLQASIERLGDNTTFCFPFYSYDNESIRAIEELGFRYAFVGGNKNARRTDNRFLVPRYPIFSYTSLNQFINMVQ